MEDKEYMNGAAKVTLLEQVAWAAEAIHRSTVESVRTVVRGVLNCPLSPEFRQFIANQTRRRIGNE